MASLEHLRNEHEWLETQDSTHVQQETSLLGLSPVVIGGAKKQKHLKDVFDWLLKEVQLIRTYNSLYVERTRIGVNECFAMVSQRDAEV